MTEGYFYIAINNSSIPAVIVSAKRVKAVDPTRPIAVVTDQRITEQGVFDQVITVPSKIDLDGFRELDAYSHQGLIGKVRYFYKSPYDTTIFLDCDTYLCAPVNDVFALADVYDMAGSHCSGHGLNFRYPEVPECFTLINTGVIMYRKNAIVEAFMNRWWDIMAIQKDPWADQSFFQAALWEFRDKLRFLALSYEYNLRFIFPCYVSGGVKILHGREEGMDKIAEKINEWPGTSRVWYRKEIVCWYDPYKGFIKA